MTSTGTILVVVFAGVLGTAYFVYGKKQSRASFMLAGAALCVYPYFVDSFWASALFGVALAAVPFFVEW
jgi:hypothetical protein